MVAQIFIYPGQWLKFKTIILSFFAFKVNGSKLT